MPQACCALAMRLRPTWQKGCQHKASLCEDDCEEDGVGGLPVARYDCAEVSVEVQDEAEQPCSRQQRCSCHINQSPSHWLEVLFAHQIHGNAWLAASHAFSSPSDAEPPGACRCCSGCMRGVIQRQGPCRHCQQDGQFGDPPGQVICGGCAGHCIRHLRSSMACHLDTDGTASCWALSLSVLGVEKPSRGHTCLLQNAEGCCEMTPEGCRVVLGPRALVRHVKCLMWCLWYKKTYCRGPHAGTPRLGNALISMRSYGKGLTRPSRRLLQVDSVDY